MKSTNWTSLLLTGDLKTLTYMQNKLKAIEDSAFNFFCSADTRQEEANLTRNQKSKPINSFLIENKESYSSPQFTQHSNLILTPQSPPQFWRPQLINEYEIISEQMMWSLLPSGHKNHQRLQQKRLEIVMKFERILNNLLSEVDSEYNLSLKKQINDEITYEQYKQMKQQINYDISWQIFDEINQPNDLFQYIDLNCLDLPDAQAIVKQKIYDVALLYEGDQSSLQLQKLLCPISEANLILIVQTGENHVVQVKPKEYQDNSYLNTVNGIVQTIKDELQLNHFYLPNQKVVLVKIDENTINCTQFKEL